MRINYNVSAMLSNNALANNDNLLAKSLERLSSGLKINHAKDNPAGLAMSKRMNAQLEGLSVANQNASDGISIIEIADGALTEVSDMLQRMNELSVKAAHGVLTDEDRQTIQDEIAQLKDEITRVSETTEFNGQPLLNGEFSFKGYTDRLGVAVNSYTDTVPVKVYEIQSLTVNKETVDGKEVLTMNPDTIVPGADFPAGHPGIHRRGSVLRLLRSDRTEPESGAGDHRQQGLRRVHRSDRCIPARQHSYHLCGPGKAKPLLWLQRPALLPGAGNSRGLGILLELRQRL